MRRVLAMLTFGVLATGCAGSEVTRPPTPADHPAASEPTLAKGSSVALSPTATLDDAIQRLVPSLGPAGAALGTPLQQLSASGQLLDARLLDATRRQLDGISATLPAEQLPDADALRLSLDALAVLVAK